MCWAVNTYKSALQSVVLAVMTVGTEALYKESHVLHGTARNRRLYLLVLLLAVQHHRHVGHLMLLVQNVYQRLVGL